MKKILFIILLLCSLHPYAQNRFTVSGTVKDSKTGETLIGATITLAERPSAASLSNTYGFYSITAPEGKYTMITSFLGYKNDTIAVSLSENRMQLIELQPLADVLAEVLITARETGNITKTLPGLQKISIEDIKNVPVIFGEKDILKTIQLLPGIKSGGDGTTGFFVRGGGADQNLILLDEATVYNASHLLGFFSTFNSDAIKDVSIYKGDMPAQFGGRLSSLLDIKMNDGNNKEYRVSGGIGLIASRLNVEGPLVKNKGSFIVSARRTYADLFLKLSKDSSVNQSILYFYDINAKANYQVGEKDKIFLSAYLGNDKLGFSDQFGINWGNTTATLRWNHIFNNRLFSNTSLIFSNYKYNIIINETNNNLAILSNIREFTLKEDLQFYHGSKNKFHTGFKISRHIFTPGQIKSSATSSYNPLALPDKHALEAALYASDEWAIGKLTFNSGLRASLFSLTGPGSFYTYNEDGSVADTTQLARGKFLNPYLKLEPRFATVWQLNKTRSIKFSYSVNVQNLHLLSNTTGGNPTDIWIPSSNNVKPEISEQASGGYYFMLRDNRYELSAELYYRWLQNQIDYKNGAVLTINEAVESQLLFGKGRSYGLELFAKKRYGALTGWISYTLSRTERQVDGINHNKWYPARQDQTHNIAIVAIYKLNKKWTFSSDFVFNTGDAVSWPSGKYQVNGTTAFYYTERNGYRMPPYHRMDISATLQTKKTQKVDRSWTFSVYNMYGRENPYFIQFRDDPANPQKTQAIQYSLFRWVPSVSYNFKF